MFLQNLPTMNLLDPIFYRTLFYDFRPVISPGRIHVIFETSQLNKPCLQLEALDVCYPYFGCHEIYSSHVGG
jgi:hypothetical protein